MIIARAFRWREMLENGTHATTAEIAAFAASTIDSNRFVEKTPKFETQLEYHSHIESDFRKSVDRMRHWNDPLHRQHTAGPKGFYEQEPRTNPNESCTQHWIRRQPRRH